MKSISCPDGWEPEYKTAPKARQKKSCDGCSALLEGSCGDGCSCYLGYSISYAGTPEEPCPKPRTNTKMVELHMAGKESWKTNTH